ncbi:hypothetical protein HYC85_009204 [Camellia sinensis]|uniref:Uncharacterized protein n=1 Tax=Camellia sinensis TaxID=4442 RepID=A0A7J7HEB7_CAMSI|nr:hypothetical protein HYC85_009204 [Camellia sinensis]
MLKGRAATTLMMGEDMHKFSLSWLDRNEFPMNSGLEMVNPGSRQIYLTFPADSTFREEDVSNYSRYKHSHVFFVNVNGKLQEAEASAATNGEMRVLSMW